MSRQFFRGFLTGTGSLLVGLLAMVLWTEPSLSAPPHAPIVLDSSDVDFYLDVLRLTAHRVRHPSELDLEDARIAESAQARQKQVYADFQTHHLNGRIATNAEITELKASDPNRAEIAAIRHTTTLRLHPDIVIVDEYQFDRIRYVQIRSVIERELALCDSGRRLPADRFSRAQISSPTIDPSIDADHRNSLLLRLYLPEIRKRHMQMMNGAVVDTD